MPRLLSATILSTFTLLAQAQGFDWSLVHGNWAESERHRYGCRDDNLHQTFVVSDDKKTLTFKLDRLWTIGTGEQTRQYSATVLAQRENALIIRYGDELKGVPEEMRTWELRFIGPGTYRWRANAWGPDEFNEVIGVKCSP
jgi:hypothetical protein